MKNWIRYGVFVSCVSLASVSAFSQSGLGKGKREQGGGGQTQGGSTQGGSSQGGALGNLGKGGGGSQTQGGSGGRTQGGGSSQGSGLGKSQGGGSTQGGSGGRTQGGGSSQGSGLGKSQGGGSTQGGSGGRTQGGGSSQGGGLGNLGKGGGQTQGGGSTTGRTTGGGSSQGGSLGNLGKGGGQSQGGGSTTGRTTGGGSSQGGGLGNLGKGGQTQGGSSTGRITIGGNDSNRGNSGNQGTLGKVGGGRLGGGNYTGSNNQNIQGLGRGRGEDTGRFEVPNLNKGSIASQVNRQENTRPGDWNRGNNNNYGGYRNGYCQYDNRWNDSFFAYPYYSFTLNVGRCTVSPWYYYSNLPGYIMINRIIFVDNFRGCNWGSGDVYNWNSWNGNGSYGGSRYRDGLDEAILDLQRSFERQDRRSLDSLVGRNRVNVYLDGSYAYSLNSNDFYDLMMDNIYGTRTERYEISRVYKNRNGAEVRAKHHFIDAFGRSQCVIHTYQLEEYRGEYTITDFSSGTRSNW